MHSALQDSVLWRWNKPYEDAHQVVIQALKNTRAFFTIKCYVTWLMINTIICRPLMTHGVARL